MQCRRKGGILQGNMKAQVEELVRAGIIFPDILVSSMSPTRGGNIIIVR